MTSILLGLLALVSTSNAFFPSDFREYVAGRGGTSHQGMTREVINNILIGPDTYFPGEATRLTTYMIAAREEITDANMQVDDDEAHDSAAHFDGENFPGGQARLSGSVAKIKAALSSSPLDVKLARSELGSALHTLQDFYSHSNWIELGNRLPHPDLGTETSLVFAPERADTCKDCPGDFDLGCAATCAVRSSNPFITGICLALCTCPDCSSNLDTSLLTSGYYGGEGRDVPAGVAKCNHGGLTDFSTPSIGQYRAGINKDSFSCNWSPHSNLHTEAVTVAKLATRQYIDLVTRDLTTPQKRILFGVGPPLAFAIDTTGSMGGYIAAVREETKRIVQGRIGTPDQPSVFVLAPFNDPGTGPVTATSDPIAFAAALDSLPAVGGGDCPELAMAGISLALNSLPLGGNLVVITDASAKDAAQASSVIAMAVANKVKVFFFLFGNVCGTGEPAYVEIAAATGGQVLVGLSLSDAGLITTLIDVAVRADYEDLVRVTPDGALPEIDLTGPGVVKRHVVLARAVFASTVRFSVDSTMASLTFSVSGGRTVVLTRPDGTVVGATDAGVRRVALSSGVIVSIVTPAAGTWTLVVSDCNVCSVSIFGETPLHFTSFDLVESRGGHPGYFPIKEVPVVGCSYLAVARVDGDFSDAAWELRSATGAFLRSFIMEEGSGEPGMPPKGSFLGNVLVPAESFQVYFRAKDPAGNPLLRVLPGLITGVVGGRCPVEPTFPSTNGTNTTTSSTSSTTSSSSATSSTSSSGTVTGTGVTTSYNSASTSLWTNSTTTRTGPTYPGQSTLTTTSTHIVTTCTSAACHACTEKHCHHDTMVDTVTTITKQWTTVCSVPTTITSGTCTTVETNLATLTRMVTVESIVPCSTCVGVNYPHATLTEKPHGTVKEGPGKTTVATAGAAAVGIGGVVGVVLGLLVL
ncbi:hypothetical protein B0T25DRAFT_628270 [Lasiosphaeria hispida]|uniref:VWFA domain-containing protein n=1 Tax=Lasiosphaeria hispida TaxID=260671 RepID=A0AAJ0HXG0_9PEZI|nr:hypothetical protein B0T25DRAFT_628270 [Lasiosphaeria hispida]